MELDLILFWQWLHFLGFSPLCNFRWHLKWAISKNQFGQHLHNFTYTFSTHEMEIRFFSPFSTMRCQMVSWNTQILPFFLTFAAFGAQTIGCIIIVMAWLDIFASGCRALSSRRLLALQAEDCNLVWTRLIRPSSQGEPQDPHGGTPILSASLQETKASFTTITDRRDRDVLMGKVVPIHAVRSNSNPTELAANFVS